MARKSLLPLILIAGLIFCGEVSISGEPSASGLTSEASSLNALLRNGSFREAGDVADGLLLHRPQDPETKSLCGLALLKMGRIADAEVLFRDVLSRFPDHPEAHLGLGRIGRIRNDPETAVRHLRRALRSEKFWQEALRQLWKAGMDRGIVSELIEIHALAQERFKKARLPIPGWFVDGFSTIQGFKAERLSEMTGSFERISVPLIRFGDHSIRMISLRLNGKSDYPFDVDSASPDFVTVSPLLAKEMGLREWGHSAAVGVGSGSAPARFSMLDSVEVGSITFRNVPVAVSDLYIFRGMKKGLIGTGFLKRFNCSIDIQAGTMDLFPLDRPGLFRANIDPSAVVADVPLYLFDAATVEASLEGAPRSLYILDSAAGTNLVDSDFFLDYLKGAVDPSRIVPCSITGARGVQKVNRVENLSIKLGSIVCDKQAVSEFSMDALNAATERYTAGLLGNPVLWPYRVHFDFRAGRLILEKHWTSH